MADMSLMLLEEKGEGFLLRARGLVDCIASRRSSVLLPERGPKRPRREGWLFLGPSLRSPGTGSMAASRREEMASLVLYGAERGD